MNKSLLVYIVMALVTADWAFAENGVKDTQSSLRAEQLLSEQQTDRDQMLEALTSQHHEVSGRLLRMLDEANTKFRTNNLYHSPLHSTILAVDTWQVLKADRLLLSMVDYELNPKSLPLGMDVPGDYFYPAASALVHLRTDIEKIEDAIEYAENRKQVRILTWVLMQRAGGIEKAKITLTGFQGQFHGEKGKQNIKNAIEMLNDSSNLLPFPGVGG
jgi:hypothetical protein